MIIMMIMMNAEHRKPNTKRTTNQNGQPCNEKKINTRILWYIYINKYENSTLQHLLNNRVLMYWTCANCWIWIVRVFVIYTKCSIVCVCVRIVRVLVIKPLIYRRATRAGCDGADETRKRNAKTGSKRHTHTPTTESKRKPFKLVLLC